MSFNLHLTEPFTRTALPNLGADRSVGSAGGWLQVGDSSRAGLRFCTDGRRQGGGHGALSNTMGLGVDRVVRIFDICPRCDEC